MRRQTKIVVAAGTLGAIVLAGAGIVAANGSTAEDAHEADTPITGSNLERASRAALDHLGGGRVTDTEIDDEESTYEVEVTRGDGSQVDVQLDANFSVVSTEADESDEEEN